MLLAVNFCIWPTINAEPFKIWMRKWSRILKYSTAKIRPNLKFSKAKIKSNFKIFESENEVEF